MSQGTTTAELAPEDDVPGASRTSAILERARAASPQPATPGAEEARATRPKSSPLMRDAMMLTRRAHLYAGLLMLPWVLLYGVTGLLFNHPTWFSDQSFTPIGADEIKGTPIEKLPSASDLAGQVVGLINARTNGSYRLVQAENARFDRGGLSASFAAADGKPYTVSLEPGGTGGTLRAGEAQQQQGGGMGGRQQGGGREGGPRGRGDAAEEGDAREGEARGRREGGPRGEQAAGGEEGRPRRGRAEGAPGEGEGRMRGGRGGRDADGEGHGGHGGGEGEGHGGPRGGGQGARSAPAPFAAAGGMDLESSPLETIRQGLPALLAKLGYDKARVSEVRSAPLAFLMEGDGKRWQVSYNMLLGSVSGRAIEEGAPVTELSNRRFLLRLHMLHGYPSTFGARWIWAVLVDAMSSLMIFWGISGVFMWWQIKRTRVVGGVAMLFSLAAALWVFMEMHVMMLSGGR